MKICVYGASSERIDPVYFEAAFALGSLLARGGHSLVYGGGREGLMGACARGALSEGGDVLGIAPRFFDEPGVLLKENCRFLFTETMSERKRLMEDEADAFIALPGGIGTYEEFFETLTLRQLGRHQKPMALLNTRGYYEPFVALLRQTAEQGFMSESVMALFALCATPEEALVHVLKPVSAPEGMAGLAGYSR